MLFIKSELAAEPDFLPISQAIFYPFIDPDRSLTYFLPAHRGPLTDPVTYIFLLSAANAVLIKRAQALMIQF